MTSPPSSPPFTPLIPLLFLPGPWWPNLYKGSILANNTSLLRNTGYAFCVGATDVIISRTSSASPTSTEPSAADPSPTQANNSVANLNKYAIAQSGDYCSVIAVSSTEGCVHDQRRNSHPNSGSCTKSSPAATAPLSPTCTLGTVCSIVMGVGFQGDLWGKSETGEVGRVTCAA